MVLPASARTLHHSPGRTHLGWSSPNKGQNARACHYSQSSPSAASMRTSLKALFSQCQPSRLITEKSPEKAHSAVSSRFTDPLAKVAARSTACLSGARLSLPPDNEPLKLSAEKKRRPSGNWNHWTRGRSRFLLRVFCAEFGGPVPATQRHKRIQHGSNRTATLRAVTCSRILPLIITISVEADGTLWDFSSVMQEALSRTLLERADPCPWITGRSLHRH